MYDYNEQMRSDIIQAIADSWTLDDLIDALDNDPDDLKEKLNDDLWVDDGVTGNASGSYTFNSYRAQEYVLENMEQVAYMACEWDIDAKTIGEKFLDGEWEWFDVSIRCYLLNGVVDELIDDLVDCLDALKAEKELTVNAIENALEAA